jgi:hypothetical protein
MQGMCRWYGDLGPHQATFALLMISCSHVVGAVVAIGDVQAPSRADPVPAAGLDDDAADLQERLGQRWVTR